MVTRKASNGFLFKRRLYRQTCFVSVASGNGGCALRFGFSRPGYPKGDGPPHVHSLAFLGNTLFCLGFADQASAQSNAAIAEARRLCHPPSLAGSLAIGVRILSLIGDTAIFGGWVAELVAVAANQGLPIWHMVGTFYLGGIKVKNNEVAEGMSLLRTGLGAYSITRRAEWRPQKASTQVDDALQMPEGTGEQWAVAELNRRKGRLLLRQGHAEPPKSCTVKTWASPGSRRPSSGSCALSASLARLLRDQGRRAASSSRQSTAGLPKGSIPPI